MRFGSHDDRQQTTFMSRVMQKRGPAGQGGIAVRDVARLVLVMFLGALCFPLIFAGQDMAPPLTFAALRSLIAGVALLLPAFALRRPQPQGRYSWLMLAAVGLTATSLGFGGMFLAGGLVSLGLATVLANIQPLIAAVLAFFILGEHLGPRRRTGLSLGFAGILLVALPGFAADGDSAALSGIGYILLGAVGVAVSNVLLKRLAGRVDPLMAAGWQFILGGIPLLALAVWFEVSEQVTWSAAFVTVLLALSLFGTAASFAIWISLLHRNELNRLNTFTFLTPAFALFIGALFFNERLQWLQVVGIGLILAGVVWISLGTTPDQRLDRVS